MSLGVVVKGSEGLVLAVDGRVTLLAQGPHQRFLTATHLDNVPKLLTFRGEPHRWIGAVTYGQAVIGNTPDNLRTAHSYLAELENSLPRERLSVLAFAEHLSRFYMRRWEEALMPVPFPASGMAFVVAGFDPGDPYGSVCDFDVPNQPQPELRSVGEFSVTWGGETEFASRILSGYDQRILPIVREILQVDDEEMERLRSALQPLAFDAPLNILPLQGCIDLAVFIIRTTMSAQRLSVGVRGVGGNIDIAAITDAEGVRIIQQKQLVGEAGEDEG